MRENRTHFPLASENDENTSKAFQFRGVDLSKTKLVEKFIQHTMSHYLTKTENI